jgi:hypothetical protein
MDRNCYLLPKVHSTPFGFYDNDYQFRQDAVKVAKFCAQRLGYPSMDIEMGVVQFFAVLKKLNYIWK